MEKQRQNLSVLVFVWVYMLIVDDLSINNFFESYNFFLFSFYTFLLHLRCLCVRFFFYLKLLSQWHVLLLFSIDWNRFAVSNTSFILFAVVVIHTFFFSVLLIRFQRLIGIVLYTLIWIVPFFRLFVCLVHNTHMKRIVCIVLYAISYYFECWTCKISFFDSSLFSNSFHLFFAPIFSCVYCLISFLHQIDFDSVLKCRKKLFYFYKIRSLAAILLQNQHLIYICSNELLITIINQLNHIHVCILSNQK